MTTPAPMPGRDRSTSATPSIPWEDRPAELRDFSGEPVLITDEKAIGVVRNALSPPTSATPPPHPGPPPADPGPAMEL